jgi:pyrroloquinoline quinone (PQQ) biosynthesis protein C
MNVAMSSLKQASDVKIVYTAIWCSFLVKHLHTLANLCWYLTADADAIGSIILESLRKLELLDPESLSSTGAYLQARNVVIERSINYLRLHRPPDQIHEMSRFEEVTSLLEDTLWMQAFDESRYGSGVLRE